jgi:flagellar hook-length control protein FliK
MQGQPQTDSQAQAPAQPQTQSQPQNQAHVQAAPTATVATDLASTAAPTTSATQAAQPTPPAATVPTRYAVSLQHAVETVRATIELGVRQGAGQARIELSPPSLGTIRIQLQHSDDGVTARVVTDHAATADTLSQGGDDLRRALQSAGVTLLRLDIETRGDSSGQAQDPAQHAGARQSHAPDRADASPDADPAPATIEALPDRALVNVLA